MVIKKNTKKQNEATKPNKTRCLQVPLFYDDYLADDSV